MVVMSVAASAQNFKWAYVDFNELVMLMPEMDSARATMEENQKTNEEILVAMYDEYQAKYQQYQQKQATWTPAIRESKEKEIMEIQSRLEQTQQSLQQEMQQLQQTLFAPVYEKASKAIEKIGANGSFTYIIDLSAGALIYKGTSSIDLLPEAKKELGIPADKTQPTQFNTQPAE